LKIERFQTINLAIARHGSGNPDCLEGATIGFDEPSQLGIEDFVNVILGREFPLVDMSTDFQSEATVPEPDNTTAKPESTNTVTSALGEEATQQIQEIWTKVSGVLGNLPDYVTDFFLEYKRPLVTVGLIVGAVVSVKLLLAILGAVNELPLLAPTFELVGLGYSGWFIYRYLLRDANRQELMENLTALRDQVLGKRG
jgi:hypothetical protein